MEYDYLCIDNAGKEFRGSVAAQDAPDARSKLKAMGLLVVEIREKVVPSERWTRLRRKKITNSDIYNFSRELTVLLNAGMSIDRAMELLLSTQANAELRDLMQTVLRDIKGGKSLSQSFQESGRFNPFVTVMIRVGESTGDLKSAFDNIAQYMNFQIKFGNEIKNTMAYPLFLIVASFVILIAIFKLIVPRFFSIFGQNIDSLPFLSRMLYHVSEAVNSTVLLIAAGTVGVFLVFSKKLNYRALFSRGYSYLLYIPLFNRLVINLELSRFCFSMYSMLKSGIEFIRALALSKEVVQNRAMRAEIERTIPQIKEGKGIAETFSYLSFVPPTMLGMLKVGENSGNLKEIFFELYSVFDEKFRNAMKRIIVLLEPTVITVMGLIVGIIVVSLILTVMSVSNIKL